MKTDTVGIIGWGVNGVTVGIRLLEAGIPAEIVCRESTPCTTSDVAGAFWFPYKSEPRDRVTAWSAESYQIFRELARSASTGVSETDVYHLYPDVIPEPWWAGCASNLKKHEAAELCTSYRGEGGESHPYKGAYSYSTFLIETPIYMPYLRSRFAELGGTVKQEEIRTLADLTGRYHTVVNCSGVWSKQVANDPESYPIRGQVVRVRRDKRTPPTVVEAADRYIVPRTNDTIIGGFNEENSWSLEPDPAGRRELLRRAAELGRYLGIHGFEDPEVLGDGVGLRPGRSSVRLEKETLPGGLKVVHNYGHGGSGFTLSWGCADEVRSLIQ